MKGVGLVKENEGKEKKRKEKGYKRKGKLVFFRGEGKRKRKVGRARRGRLWVEDTQDSIYRSQSNEPLGVLIT